MDSQRRLGRGPSNRITRSWYPGGRAGSRRSREGEALLSRSRGTSGLGTDVGYWGRVDSQGDFEEGTGFLVPFRSPGRAWRSLVAVKMIMKSVYELSSPSSSSLGRRALFSTA